MSAAYCAGQPKDKLLLRELNKTYPSA